jgi:dihydroorotase
MSIQVLVLATLSILPVCAQSYDFVLHGGHVIDRANGLDGVMDVAITGGRIAAVQSRIPAAQAKKYVDVSGLYVVPGLIDLHAHVFGYSGTIPPDDTSLVAGTTTVVDAGGSGWRTFDEFRRTVIATSKTRVLALINIVGKGMVGPAAEDDVNDMDSARTAAAIQANRDRIVGIKTAHFGGKGWTAIDRAVAAGRLATVPVMVDDHIFTDSGRTTREKLLEHLRPGDIHTHMYNDRQIELLNRFTGAVQPYMLEARRRGVLFDLGHGAGSFLWPVATKAMAQGFIPDTISTDLHSASLLGPQSDMPNCISKMMLLGMSLSDAVQRSTVNPAKEIGRFPEIGTLGVGREADVAVLEPQTGVFAFKDAWGAKRLGSTRVQALMTFRGGELAYQRERRTAAAGPQEIYDLLLKNGTVSGRQLDIAVIGNKIARMGTGLPASHARLVVDVSEYRIGPGLSEPAPQPNYRMLRNCVTTSGKAGSLKEGEVADVAVLDSTGARCAMTVRRGSIVWDADGLAATDWTRVGPYSNFK